MSRRRNRAFAWLFLTFASLFAPAALLADDCARDWRRAEDCLRSDGFAQGIGTTVATVVTVLVNGAVIATQVFNKPPEEAADDGQKKDRHYSLDLRTEDSATELAVMDYLSVYARVTCDDPEVDAGSITNGLDFNVSGPAAEWVQMDPAEMVSGFKSVTLYAEPPSEEAVVDPNNNMVTVTVGANIDGKPISGSVEIFLIDDMWELDIWEEE